MVNHPWEYHLDTFPIYACFLYISVTSQQISSTDFNITCITVYPMHTTLQVQYYRLASADKRMFSTLFPYFLNQACAGRTPGFLKLILCGSSICVFGCVCVRVCVCVCVSAPEAIKTSQSSGVMWCDMDSIRLVKQVLQLLYGNCSRYC